MLGSFDGFIDGSLLKSLLGSFDGTLLGSFDGSFLGSFDGSLLGSFDGSFLGSFLGSFDCSFLGFFDGSFHGGLLLVIHDVSSHCLEFDGIFSFVSSSLGSFAGFLVCVVL